MLTKRIVPCLDIKNGRTVKGTQFKMLRDAGDPVQLAAAYSQQGADELVFLDISASEERRKTLAPLVEEIAKNINIPFTVGGGISTPADVARMLHAGADKTAVNSAALRRPELIDELAAKFGSQCIVLAVDAKIESGIWKVYSIGAKQATGRNLFEWVKEAEDRGAGEILFTSIDHDGSKTGYANEALAHLSENCRLPIIASGGAGKVEDFITVFQQGKADAALAASVFHFGEIAIPDLKSKLLAEGIPCRI